MKTTKPKPFIFVLMPFSGEFDDVYKLGIKPACENIGAYAERVDEQIFSGSILERVYNQIAKADVIIADMTGRNPNVFYETGYAHALGKNVILLTQDVDDIPFDLRHFPHIIYEGKVHKILPELEKRVRWYIEHSSRFSTDQFSFVQVSYHGQNLRENQLIEFMNTRHEPVQLIDLRFDIHNSTEHVMKDLSCRVAVETSVNMSCRDDRHFPYESIKIPDSGFIHVSKEQFTIFPDGWHTFNLVVYPIKDMHPNDEESLIFRLLTEGGKVDFPFILRVCEGAELE